MIKKGHKTILYIVVILLLIGLLLWAFQKFPQKSTTSTPTPAQPTIVLPQTVLDSTMTVSSTDLSFSYPSAGFYGLGLTLIPQPTKDVSGLIAGVATNPVASFTDEKTSEYVVMNVSLFDNKHMLAPEEWIDALSGSDYDKQYAKLNGKNITIGEHVYFVYEVTESVTTWHALAASKEGMVSVTLAYTGSDKPESQAAYAHNDELFSEILSHVDFE